MIRGDWAINNSTNFMVRYINEYWKRGAPALLEVETIETAKRMVERGMGLAFLPHLAVVREVQRGRLVAIEVRGAEPLSRSLDVIHPRQRPLSAEALALLRALRLAVASNVRNRAGSAGPARRAAVASTSSATRRC